MKTIQLQQTHQEVEALCHTAEEEPILLLTMDGHEFILSQADRFDEEVDILRNSERFQAFLDRRMRTQPRYSLEELEQELEEELRQSSYSPSPIS